MEKAERVLRSRRPTERPMTSSEARTRGSHRRLLFLAALAMLLGLGWLSYQVHQVLTWNGAVAEVVSVQSFRSTNPGGGSPTTTYEPTLRFVDASGRQRTARPGYRSSQFDFDRGERIPIAYDPEAPQFIRVTTFMSYWAMPLVATAFGLLVFHLSGGFGALRRSSPSESPSN